MWKTMQKICKPDQSMQGEGEDGLTGYQQVNMQELDCYFDLFLQFHISIVKISNLPKQSSLGHARPGIGWQRGRLYQVAARAYWAFEICRFRIESIELYETTTLDILFVLWRRWRGSGLFEVIYGCWCCKTRWPICGRIVWQDDRGAYSYVAWSGE